MELAGKSRTRPPGNDTVTYEQYSKLRDQFVDHRNIAKAATIAGIGIHTAERYINTGTPTFPAIKPWADALVSKLLMEKEQDLAVQLRNREGAGLAMEAGIMRTLAKIEFVPKGSVNAEGKIQVDEKTFKTMASTLKLLHDYSLSVRGVNNTQGDVNVNVNVSNTNVQGPVVAEAQALEDKFGALLAKFIGNQQSLGRALADRASQDIGSGRPDGSGS